MKILILGSGGREHALAWKISRSPHTVRLFSAPGSAGIAQVAECIPLDSGDFAGIKQFAKSNGIDLVVVGPEQPLVEGISDQLEIEGIRVFGPNAAGSRLEGSKVITKKLLKDCKIPTANFECFSDAKKAMTFLKKREFPLVVKADGLAAGKGVMICHKREEALQAIEEILEKKLFGSHQSQVVIEDFLVGEEASFMGVTDGKTFLPLATSQDHKRVFDGDRGPNTGGMGAYSPAPLVTPEIHEKVMKQIIYPTLEGLKSAGVKYRGILYGGLMIDQGNPFLLEYNVRFGDPECQAILPRLSSDFVEVMIATVEGSLSKHIMKWDERSSVCVVLASEGYPGNYQKGKVIEGIEEAQRMPDVLIFHAGTARRDGQWFTNGGRVLGVTAFGNTLEKAMDRAYTAVQKIHWEGMHYRKDIGEKGIGRI